MLPYATPCRQVYRCVTDGGRGNSHCAAAGAVSIICLLSGRGRSPHHGLAVRAVADALRRGRPQRVAFDPTGTAGLGDDIRMLVE
jgi:hypothetical protein